MKKGISIVLCLCLLFSVFSVCGVAAKTADANDAMYVKSGGFENGKITYTVYLRKNISFDGAVMHFAFDSDVLQVVSGGAYGGDNNPKVPGVYASGMIDDSEDVYAIGYVNYDLYNAYKTGSSDKAFMKITFKVIGASRPRTNVDFFCAEFNSKDENLNIPKNDENPQLFYSHETSTLNKTKFVGVTSVENGLEIEWEATKGAEGYRVFKENADGDMKKLCDLPATQTRYVDETAVANVVSTYTVRALDADGKLDSGRSDDVSGVYIKSPSSITATAQATGVKLSWSKVAGATGYRVSRREINTDGTRGSWLFLASTKSSVTSYVDKEELESGAHYEYTVRTVKDKKYSAVYKFADIWYYEAPTAKVASVLGGVKVSWNAVNGAETYKIYRKYSGSSSWTLIGTVKANKLKFIDEKAVTGKKITYAVRAFSSNGSSKYIAKTISYVATPVLKSLTNATNGLKLKWNAVKNATGYEVYRKAPGATKWTRIATVKNTYYTDKNVKSGKTYKYTVKTVSNKLKSGYDTTGLALKYLATPKLTKISNAAKGINIKWESVSGAAEYKVYRKAAGQSSWVSVGEVTTTSFTDKDVKNRTTYTYTVKAVSGDVASNYNKTGLSIKRVK